jgi:hypothetical protein
MKVALFFSLCKPIHEMKRLWIFALIAVKFINFMDANPISAYEKTF